MLKMEEIPITPQNDFSITEEMKNELRENLLSYIDDTYEWNEKMAHRITSIVMIFYEYNDLRMKLLYNKYDLNVYLLDLKVILNTKQIYFNNQIQDKEEMYLIDSILEINEITEEMTLKLKEELVEIIISLFKYQRTFTERIVEKLMGKYGYQYLKLKLALQLITSQFLSPFKDEIVVTRKMKSELREKLFNYIVEKHQFDTEMTERIVDVIIKGNDHFYLLDLYHYDNDELDGLITETKCELTEEKSEMEKEKEKEKNRHLLNNLQGKKKRKENDNITMGEKPKQRQNTRREQKQKVKQEQPKVVEKEVVTEEMKNDLGDNLYDYIFEKHQFDEEMTGRITGVLLESLEYPELKNKLEKNKEELDVIIKEVKVTLENMEEQ